MLDSYELLMNIKDKPTLLLHCCCGPCSTQVIEFLLPFFTITAYYYNPNTQPFAEYIKRLEELKKVVEIYQIPLIIGEYDDSFVNISQGLENEKEGNSRCDGCYKLRINKTFLEAKIKGFSYFTTTLSISPYKNSAKINEIGFALETEEVKFVYSNFKENNGYFKSIELSKKYKLYRQKYCGCLFSIL